MNTKKLIQSVKDFDKLFYAKLAQCDDRDVLIQRLYRGFYSLGPSVVRLQYAADCEETYKYTLDALKACAVIEYNLSIIDKGVSDLSEVVQGAHKLKRVITKELKAIKRAVKVDLHFQDKWKIPLYNVVSEQLARAARSLISLDCDEATFAEEAHKIVNQIIPTADVNYIAHVMERVIFLSFDYGIVFDNNAFLSFAEKIFEVLNKTVVDMTTQGKFTVYYKVVFRDFDYEYTYLYDGNDVHIGDHVLVPTGDGQIKTPARVTDVHTVFTKNKTLSERSTSFKSIIRRISIDEYEDSIFTEGYVWK